MNFNEYQKETGKLALPTSENLEYLIAGLCAESGEVAGKYAKVIRDKNGVFSKTDSDEIIKEVGDCLWFLSEISRIQGYKFNYVAESNISKLNDRKTRGVLSGSGDNR